MTERILIQAGMRNGRTFDNEAEFRSALAEGKEVFTHRNGVYFQVTADGDGVRYAAQTSKPEGV